MIYKVLPLFLLSLMSFESVPVIKENIKESTIEKNIITDPKLLAEKAKAEFEVKCKSFYESLSTENYSLPQFESFSRAFFISNDTIASSSTINIFIFIPPSYLNCNTIF